MSAKSANNDDFRSLFNGKNVLCAINSSVYQLVSLVSIGLAVKEEASRFDLVVPAVLPNYEYIFDAASSSNAFTSVTLVRMPYDQSAHMLRTYLFDSAFRESMLEKSLIEDTLNLADHNYNFYLYPSYTATVLDVKKFLAPRAVSILYDEGSGSYNGLQFGTQLCGDNIETKTSALLSRKGQRHLKKSFPSLILGRKAVLNPRYQACFRPELVCEPLRKYSQILKIDFLLNKTWARNLLPKHLDKRYFENIAMIFFTLSDNCSDTLLREEYGLLKELSAHFGRRLLVKIHPGRTVTNAFTKLECQFMPREWPWEIILASGLIGQNINLVAVYSSAQLAPCILLGKDQPIICLFELVSASDMSRLAMRNAIQSVKDCYQNKDLVKVPLTREQFYSAFITDGGV